jgi:hypothetical protein
MGTGEERRGESKTQKRVQITTKNKKQKTNNGK